MALTAAWVEPSRLHNNMAFREVDLRPQSMLRRRKVNSTLKEASKKESPSFSQKPSIFFCDTVTSANLPLQGVSRSCKQHMSWASHRATNSLFELLHQAGRELKVAVLESTSIMVQVMNTLADIHAQVMQLDEELENSGEADVVRECQGWLQQLQSFIIALQRDMSECREAEAQGMPDALQHWQQVVQSAAAKLCKASGFESEGEERSSRDSLDSSCSSSIYGSSSCNSSAATSKSGHRLVATRARMQYFNHWACKVAI